MAASRRWRDGRKQVSNRRNDEGSVEELATKEYGVKRRRNGGGERSTAAASRGVTARIADAVFTPTFGMIFAAVGIPTVLAGGYYLFSEHGPTPVVQARRQDEGGDGFDVTVTLAKALFEAVRGEAEKFGKKLL